MIYFLQNDKQVQPFCSSTGKCAVVLDRTTFYPEAGGQVSDKGLLSLTDGLATFEVEDVQCLDSGHVLHVGRVTEGCLQGAYTVL